MSDGAGRHAPDTRIDFALLIAILAVAAGLRLVRIDSGIPFALGIDEPELLVRAVRMMQSGDFNPHFFDYPSLPIYLHLFVAIGRFLAGAMSHEFRELAKVDFTDFVLWSRMATAAMGVATVYVTYRIGQHWGRWHALLAAALLAVVPMHVREARFALTDTPMTLCVAGALWAAIVAHERATTRAFAIAAAVAGLALGVKYTAGLVILLPLLAVWSSSAHLRVKLQRSLVVGAVWAFTFLLVAPYTVIDLPGFLNGFATLMSAYRPRALPEAPWITYLKHLRIAFGWPGVVALALGLVLAAQHVVRGPARTRWLLLAVFPVVYFVVISRQDLVYARYLMPILPAVCVMLASAVVASIDILRRFMPPRAVLAVAVVLGAAVLVPPATTSATILRLASRTSTQAEAYQWLLTNLPPGTPVVIEKFEVRLSGSRYRPMYLTRLIEKTYDEHVRSGARYMVATSQMYGLALSRPEQDPVRYREYTTLFSQVREVARFTPSADRPGPELIIFALP
ncbi:MAG: glycosyltransferase family 39 protein [Acidobacteria bacterium]|nr:glycosyltransferase family 39 protein [Acidobacteriota bacterium]